MPWGRVMIAMSRDSHQRTWAGLMAGAMLCLGSAGCGSLTKVDKDGKRTPLPRPALEAGEHLIPLPGGGQIREPARSWRSIQRQNIVLQKYDYSCGSAALATLMRYYFQDPVNEELVLTVLLRNLSKAENPQAELDDRIKQGFSMYDLFLVSKDLGYQAAVVKLPIDKLQQLPAPTVVRIEKMGYKHFVVVRGFHDDTVYMADPTRGNIRLSVQEFQAQWSGEVLVLGKAGFGLPQDHPLALKIEGPARPELQIARQALFPIY